MLYASRIRVSESDAARFVRPLLVVCNRIFQGSRLKKHPPVGLATYVQRKHLVCLLSDV